MKIRLLDDRAIEHVKYQAGAVVEVSEAVGKFLVRLHRALATDQELLTTEHTEITEKTFERKELLNAEQEQLTTKDTAAEYCRDTKEIFEREEQPREPKRKRARNTPPTPPPAPPQMSTFGEGGEGGEEEQDDAYPDE